MTTVTFENATIRDVIGKAARVAPSRGGAFDKAAGILMEIDASNFEVVVKATNLEIFYMEIVDCTGVTGESKTWRIPSSLLDGITGKLPISSGKEVTFSDEVDGGLQIVSGRMKAKMRLIDPTYFPEWVAFDEDNLENVSEFGARIQQVQWAASKSGEPPLVGVHLDGTYAVATDQYRVALAPCPAPLAEPITIPASIFTPLMKQLGDVRIGMGDNQLFVMPDDVTQIRAVIYATGYPRFEKVFKRAEPSSVTFKRAGLVEIIERAMVMGQRDRTPMLTFIIGQEEIAVMVSDVEVGLLGDVLEIPGQATHKRLSMKFSPSNLTAALTAAPNEEVTFYYDEETAKPIRIDGGSGYEAVITLRKGNEDGDK